MRTCISHLVMDKTKIVSDSLSYDENEILGKGSAGFVFSGSFGQEDKTPVAVKRLQLASLRKDEEFQKREEAALAGLSHPNVIKLLHVEEDSTFRYKIIKLFALIAKNIPSLLYASDISFWNCALHHWTSATYPTETLEDTREIYPLINKYSYKWWKVSSTFIQ